MQVGDPNQPDLLHLGQARPGWRQCSSAGERPGPFYVCELPSGGCCSDLGAGRPAEAVQVESGRQVGGLSPARPEAPVLHLMLDVDCGAPLPCKVLSSGMALAMHGAAVCWEAEAGMWARRRWCLFPVSNPSLELS